MKPSLTNLFRLLEITRAQPQYGYALAEIPKSELSDLAQHHYLVTAFAWQLGKFVICSGGKLDLLQVLEISLMHDLGELFGGDIAMPYAKANPAANKAAKAFEHENLSYLGKTFMQDSQQFADLASHATQPKTDEALIAKIADYLEVTHYKLYVHRLNKASVEMVAERIESMIENLADLTSAKAVRQFIGEWKREMLSGKSQELFEHAK